MNRTDLQMLSKDALIDLVLSLRRPDKTSRTSSEPPSTDRKERRENSRPGGAKPGYDPHNRKLEANPDAFVDQKPLVCDACGGALDGDAALDLIGEYDEIEIPPVKPHVTRHRRYGCQCKDCGHHINAAAPAVSKTTPFGPRIYPLAIDLKGFQTLSYERLRGLFRDCFGLGVSDGARMNMFIRANPAFKLEADKAIAILRQAKVIASNETGVRIEGSNCWHCGCSIARTPWSICPIIPAPGGW